VYKVVSVVIYAQIDQPSVDN